MGSNLDITTLFFQNIFGGGVVSRVMAGVIAFSISGNLVVMTFTASRVKQEIAKEGILPYSLFFARGHTTFIARIWSRYVTKQREHLEQTPIPALFLHWLSSIVLIAATSALKPMAAYSALASLYAYTTHVMVGLLVSGGFLYLYLTPSRRWDAKLNYRPFGKKLQFPIHALFYLLACIFPLVTIFAPPSASSPFFSNTWYVVPAVGISAPLWGLLWWAVIKLWSRSTATELVVHRVPNVEEDEEDPGQYILVAEVVDHAWVVQGKREVAGA